jgi:hypothetical protein
MRKCYTVPSGLLATFVILTSLILLGGALSPVQAQSSRTPATDRLFIGFAQDAVLADQQWWEGQLEFASHEDLDTVVARLNFAVRPYERIEFGGNVGFGDSDLPGTDNGEGTGATDLDLWGKYALGSMEDGSKLATGILLTIPTGDDSAGLGEDAFKIGAFLSSRRTYKPFDLAAHVGVNFNGDGQIFGFELEGKVSAVLGAGLIFRQTEQMSFVVEANLETKRFKDAGDFGDDDFSVLGGIDWRMGDNGMLRGSLAFGLSDGAQDHRLSLGYAARF